MRQRIPTIPMPYSVAAGLAVGLMYLAWVYPALAHEWFTGTKDPVTGFTCCNNRDCQEIEDTDVRQQGSGYIYLPTGEFIPRARIQQSKTYRFARCVQLWDSGPEHPKGSTRCFFEPVGF